MEFRHNDGGRAAAGYKGEADDCVCRAIAIVTELPYEEIYQLLNILGKKERTTKRKRDISSARRGVYKQTIRKAMDMLGYTWKPTMHVGQGSTVHLRAEELPRGRLVVNVSKHTTAVIDGVIYDTHDPSREGTRCVYGYFYKPHLD